MLSYILTSNCLKKSIPALNCHQVTAQSLKSPTLANNALRSLPSSCHPWGPSPHLFDPFLSIYFFSHQGSLSCICLISARRPSGMLSFSSLRLPLILLIPLLHTGMEINLYYGLYSRKFHNCICTVECESPRIRYQTLDIQPAARNVEPA